MLLSLCAGGAPAAVRERLDLRLADEMWQPLPRAVREVWVGPDQRLWITRYPDSVMDREAVKKHIEREYPRPDPQLQNVRIALFEPNGRVWFSFNDYQNGEDWILGFDGREWVERLAPEGRHFNGECPNRGRGRSHGNNLFLDGHAFFPSGGVVHHYDGEKWDTREFWPATLPRHNEHAPKLEPEPDGKGLLALVPMGNAPLARWRGGRWSLMPGPTGMAPDTWIWTAAPITNGAWLRDSDRRPTFVEFEEAIGEEHRSVDIRALITFLDNEDYRVREDATRQIIALGRSALPELLAAEAEATHPEVRGRIRRAIQEITAPPPNARVSARRTTRIGEFEVGPTHMLFPDGFGNVYVGSRTVTREGDAESGPAVLRISRDGKVSEIGRGERALARWGNLRVEWGYESGPLAVDGGKFIWTTGDRIHVPPALIEAATGKVLAEVPDPEYHYLLAARADGTLFVDRTYPGDQQESAIMVLRPNCPESRLKLTPDARLAQPVRGRFACVSPGGEVWALSPDGRLKFFDGDRWHERREENITELIAVGRAIVPSGKVGISNTPVLARRGDRWLLLHGDQAAEHANLLELVRQHAAVLVPALRHGVAYPPRQMTWRLLVDRDGNLWLLDRSAGSALHVLVKDRWIFAVPLLKQAGSPNGYVAVMAGSADRATVYVSDLVWRKGGGRSFLGRVRDGSLVFEEAPHYVEPGMLLGPALSSIIADTAGFLWFAQTPGAVVEAVLHGSQSVRLSDSGPDGEPIPATAPALVDLAGNVWLRNLGRPKTQFSIWRDGNLTSVPPMRSVTGKTRLHAAAPGSVYAWTELGLQHLVARDNNKPTEFELGKLYTFAGISGKVLDVDLAYYNGDRWFVIYSLPDPLADERAPTRLDLARVPE